MVTGTVNSLNRTSQLEGRCPGGNSSLSPGAQEGRRQAEETEATRTWEGGLSPGSGQGSGSFSPFTAPVAAASVPALWPRRLPSALSPGALHSSGPSWPSALCPHWKARLLLRGWRNVLYPVLSSTATSTLLRPLAARSFALMASDLRAATNVPTSLEIHAS